MSVVGLTFAEHARELAVSVNATFADLRYGAPDMSELYSCCVRGRAVDAVERIRSGLIWVLSAVRYRGSATERQRLLDLLAKADRLLERREEEGKAA